MASKPIWYITTPIYYVNGRPHIGSAVTTTCCDVLARYHRMRGLDTWFLTGTDENATKNVEAAEKAGVSVQEFVDTLTAEFADAWKQLHIRYNDFIHTTEPRHIRAVQEVFRRLRETGDIYKGHYEGWYCVSDETFFRDTDVNEDRLCPNPECRGELKRVQEENYFFRLSAYGDKLQRYIEEHPSFLQPDFRRNEVMSFIGQGLRDMSVTRSASVTKGWGIPVADEPDQVIYVWFDALINYLAATGWPDDEERVKQLWPANVHFMGKEIYVRFHATLWPAMLMALGLELPGTVYAHGFWVNTEGRKEGKRTGGIPHPVEFAREIADLSGASFDVSADALRYLLLREMVFHGDSVFSTESFIKRYNTDLANDIGNLCNRSATMMSRYFKGVIPQVASVDPEIAELGREVVDEYEKALAEFRFNLALESVWKLVGRMNRYIEEKAPWKLAKAGETNALARTLYTCLDAVRVTATLLSPVMPVAVNALFKQIGSAATSETATLEDARTWGLLPSGAQLPEPLPIFPRIQLPETREEPVTKLTEPEKPAVVEKQEQQSSHITIDDFLKVDLRVVDILAAETIPNATKLLKLTVKLGEETRTILAGIAEMYQPDELVGRQAVVVANLQPRKMRGIESQGMLLAADVDGQAILLQPETKTPSGSRVR